MSVTSVPSSLLNVNEVLKTFIRSLSGISLFSLAEAPAGPRQDHPLRYGPPYGNVNLRRFWIQEVPEAVA